MKAIASDLDGTLMFNRKVSDMNRNCISLFQRKGYFGLCTGRPLSGLEDIKDIYFDFYILSSGALILNKAKEPIKEFLIDKHTAESIYDEYKDQSEIIFQTNDPDHFFITSDVDIPKIAYVRSFDDIRDLKIYSVSLLFKSEEKAYKELKNLEKYEDISAYQNVDSIDIVLKGVSKGTGVQFIKEYLHVDEMMGIGDSYNDLPLFSACDVSYTFKTSPIVVQKKVDHVVSNFKEAVNLF